MPLIQVMRLLLAIMVYRHWGQPGLLANKLKQPGVLLHVISGVVVRSGFVFFRINQLLRSQPRPVRGGGKGPTDHWVAVVKSGRIIFEMGGVGEEVAKEAIRLASHKLPIKTRFVTREAGVAVSGDSVKRELAKVEA